jgi:hypothetical protein
VSELYVETDVLITVMTYPHPSQKHQELICTAGVLDDGTWVRLYPIDYRYMPNHQQFHKYQRVRLGLLPRGAGNDKRKESRRPDLKSLQILGPVIHPDERRLIMDALPHSTLIQLKAQYELDSTSLGVVRPIEVLELQVEKAEADWKPEWQAAMSQFSMFTGAPKNLRKIPFKFSYRFRCEDSEDKVHSAMIEDWELGVLFLKEAERLGSDDAAAASVKKKYFDQICAGDRDVRLLMGTVFPYNTWVVVGVYWPAKIYQPKLF